MKKIASFFILLSLVFISTYTNANSMKSEKEKYVLKVLGISCQYCVIGVRQILKETAGFQTVEVDPEQNTVVLYTDKGTCFSNEQLKKLFEGSGFSYQGVISEPSSCKKGL